MPQTIQPQDILLVVAMPEESQGLLETTGARIVYSGIGKINAAYATTRAVVEQRPRLVINFGTAGSPVFRAHDLVECTRFVQRDIDLSPLGFPKGTTPFDEIPALLETPRRLNGLIKDISEGICGTGDNFQTSLVQMSPWPDPDGLVMRAGAGAHLAPNDLPRPSVIEMEAYAIAKVCWREKLPFLCVKYVTDGSDASASADWATNLPKAASRFREIFGLVLQTRIEANSN